MLTDLCKAHSFPPHQLPDSYIGSSSQDDGLCIPLQTMMHSLCHTVDESPLGGGIDCSGFLKGFMHQVVEIGVQEAHNLSEATSSMKELLWFDNGSFNNSCQAVIELRDELHTILPNKMKKQLKNLLENGECQAIMAWQHGFTNQRILVKPLMTSHMMDRPYLIRIIPNATIACLLLIYISEPLLDSRQTIQRVK